MTSTEQSNSFSRATAPRHKGSSAATLAEDFSEALCAAIGMLGYRSRICDSILVPPDISLQQLKDDIGRVSVRSLSRKREGLTCPYIIPHCKLWNFFLRKSLQSRRWRIRILSLYSSAKRSVTCLSDEDRESAIVKHKASMAVLRPTDPSILIRLRHFVRAKLRDFDRGFTPFAKPFSSNACLEVSRSRGGPRKFFEAEGSQELSHEWRRLALSTTPKMALWECEVKTRSLLEERIRVNFSVPPLPEVRAVPLPPHNAKVRIITVGSAHFHKLVPLQARLIDYCKSRFPALVRPVHCDLISAQIGPLSSPNEFWVSGDFESATDNIHLDCTQTMMLGILDVWPEFEYLRELALRDVSSHLITYPDGDTVLQLNGQLMGSLLSFPLLCILNDFIFCSIYRNDRKLINGDDILFQSNKEDYVRWCDACTSVGLVPNMRKTLLAKRVLQMNNKYYVQKRSGDFVQVPLIYTDLLRFTYKRSEIGQVFDEFFEDFPLTSRRLSRFKSHHKSTLRVLANDLVLPRELGGLSGSGHLDFFHEKRIHRVVYNVLTHWPSDIRGPFDRILYRRGFRKGTRCVGVCHRLDAFANRLNHLDALLGVTETDTRDNSMTLRRLRFYAKRLERTSRNRTNYSLLDQVALPHRCWSTPVPGS